MRYQYFLWLMISLLLAIGFPFNAPRAVAHQATDLESIRATVHLEPEDSPYTRIPSFTWFHLTRLDGETIPLTDCNCSLVVYNSQNQPILQPQLSESEVQGHERPITTNITFPNTGTYRLVLTGQSKTDSFEPFQLSIPVTVRP